MARQTVGTMSETKGATRRKPPNKHQLTKAEMEEVIVIDATLTSSRARCWWEVRRAGSP